MAKIHTQSDFRDTGHARELFVTEGERLDNTLQVYVQEGDSLFYIITGADGSLRADRANIRVQLIGPKEQSANQDSLQTITQQVGFVESPKAGRWRLKVRGRAREDVTVSMLSLRRGRPSFLPWLGCNACKKLLRTVILVLINLALYKLVGATMVATLNAIKEWFRRTLEMSEGALSEFLNFLVDMATEPMDRIMERVCTRLGFCP